MSADSPEQPPYYRGNDLHIGLTLFRDASAASAVVCFGLLTETGSEALLRASGQAVIYAAMAELAIRVARHFGADQERAS